MEQGRAGPRAEPPDSGTDRSILTTRAVVGGHTHRSDTNKGTDAPYAACRRSRSPRRTRPGPGVMYKLRRRRRAGHSHESSRVKRSASSLSSISKSLYKLSHLADWCKASALHFPLPFHLAVLKLHLAYPIAGRPCPGRR
jgi:hypothetical protein